MSATRVARSLIRREHRKTIVAAFRLECSATSRRQLRSPWRSTVRSRGGGLPALRELLACADAFCATPEVTWRLLRPSPRLPIELQQGAAAACAFSECRYSGLRYTRTEGWPQQQRVGLRHTSPEGRPLPLGPCELRTPWPRYCRALGRG